MRTFRLMKRQMSGLTALVFFVSIVISACGGSRTPSVTQPTVDSKMLDLFDRAWPTDSVHGINAMLEQQGFTAATDELMPLFNEGREVGLLVPYETSDSRNAAIAIIEDSSGINASAAIIAGTNNGLSVVVTWHDGSIKIMPLSTSDEQNPEDTVATHWCTGDFACCFWGCMLGSCGFGSLACLYAGPFFWACILGVCGVSAYSCWQGCD